VKAKNIIILVIMTVSLLAVSCSENANSEISIEERLKQLESQRAELDNKIAELRSQLGDEKKAIPVEIMNLGQNSFSHYVSLYGEVASDQDVDMSPKSMGLVKSVNVEEGQRVTKGQTLALLDDEMVNKRIKEAKDSYEFIKTIYEKQKRVWEKNVGSELEYLKAKNDLESMENRLSILKEELTNMRIVAPFSGVIDKVYIKEGEMASPNFPVFHIVSESDLKVRADVSESVSYRLKTGEVAEVYFPDLDLDTLKLKISAVSKSIDKANRTVGVFVDLPKSIYNKVKPSMLASVRFKTAEIDSAITLPTNLIQQEGTTDYVYVAKKDESGKLVADKKIIVKGKSYSGVTEILGGIKPSENVITVGYEGLKEGDLIKTTNK
jgi:membrane fusion protein, multidrug efflux system